MTQIGADLSRRGHDVTVLTAVEHHPVVAAAGLRAVALPSAAAVRNPRSSPARSLLPALLRRLLAGRSELQSAFIEPLCHQYEALREQLADGSFDAILADVAFTGVLPLLLSAGPRPPVLVCGVGPLTLSSRDTPPFGMGWQPRGDFDYRNMTAFAHRILFGDVQGRFDRALQPACTGVLPTFITDWPRLADGLYQLSVPGFEYPRSDLPANVTFVGPVLSGTDGDFEPPDWWGELDAAPTVVHVTQGTFDNGRLDELLVPTLRGLSQRDDVLVVATTGDRQRRSLGDAIPRNARVTDWIPYSLLMPHVDVMITNGGYGGVHHALKHAVPLVVGGETSDKAEIAARVEYTGVGINLGTARPSADHVAAAVQRILDEPRHRRAAARLSAEIRGSAALDSIAELLAGQHDAVASGRVP